MTTPDLTAMSPLDMARNCVAAVRVAAEWQASDDPDRRVLAHALGIGQQGDQASKVAARLALVSIAEDMHRLTRFFTDGEPEDGLCLSYGATMEDGRVRLCGRRRRHNDSHAYEFGLAADGRSSLVPRSKVEALIRSINEGGGGWRNTDLVGDLLTQFLDAEGFDLTHGQVIR